jgi:hypothetical protein
MKLLLMSSGSFFFCWVNITLKQSVHFITTFAHLILISGDVYLLHVILVVKFVSDLRQVLLRLKLNVNPTLNERKV